MRWNGEIRDEGMHPACLEAREVHGSMIEELDMQVYCHKHAIEEAHNRFKSEIKDQIKEYEYWNAGLFLIILMLIALLFSTRVNAEDLPIDKAAHFGISWAINHTTYAVCEKIAEKKTACLIGSAIFTSAVGVAKEVYDGKKNSKNEHLKDLAADGLGILGSSLVIRLTF